jgi:hypothetical protein
MPEGLAAGKDQKQATQAAEAGKEFCILRQTQFPGPAGRIIAVDATEVAQIGEFDQSVQRGPQAGGTEIQFLD